MKNSIAVITTHIVPAVGYGGPATSVYTLVREWEKNGQPILLCSSDASTNGSIKPEDVQLGECVQVKLYHSYWFKRWAFGLGAIPAIYITCKRSKSVYINGFVTWPTTVGALICVLLKRPFVVSLRGGVMPEHVRHIRHNKPIKWWYYRLLSFSTLRRAQAIHCTGELEAETAYSILGTNVRVILAPNGVVLKPIQHKQINLETSNLVISYLGRISHEKGINSFIRTWIKERSPGERFIIAGGNGGTSEDGYFQDFLQLVAEANGDIDYLGYVNSGEVTRILNSSHFLVLPSGLDGDVRENFGNVVAEALALGTPVIVCRGLVWDGVETAGAGFVFDRNIDAVTTVLAQVKSINADQWLEMSRLARNYAERFLDINVAAQRLWNALADR